MNAPSRIEITSFPQGKRMALTTSFDDGHVHDRKIVRAFNEWGIKGTFNLNSGNLGKTGRPAPDDNKSHLDSSEIASLFQGHEVAIHTVTHPFLQRLDASQIVREVLEDRIALENLLGYPVRGMAYPFGTYNQQVIEILRHLGIRYCRGVGTGGTSFPPPEPLTWSPTAHQYGSVSELFEKYYGNERHSGVFYIWGHGYEFERTQDWAGLERIYKPLSGKPDIWYCTNIELFDYEDARQRLIIAANRATVYNPSSQPVTINVDGRLMDVPSGKLLTLATD
jgi:peptidoglycan/xylan/chitin deacetylase (PgdA/CDA1 family)